MRYQLDVRQYRCPVPVLMTKRALASLQAGDQLTVLVTEQSTVHDVQLLCEEMGYALAINDAFTLEISKPD